MIMCFLLCYPVSFHMLQLLLTGRPVFSLILKQKLLLGNPTDFCDLMNINELSLNFDLQVKYCEQMTWYCQYYSCHGWKHRTFGINISN